MIPGPGGWGKFRGTDGGGRRGAGAQGRGLAGGGSQVLLEDAVHFGNGLGVLIGPVVTGDDELALGAVEVAAPVWNDAVGTNGFDVV